MNMTVFCQFWQFLAIIISNFVSLPFLLVFLWNSNKIYVDLLILLFTSLNFSFIFSLLFLYYILNVSSFHLMFSFIFEGIQPSTVSNVFLNLFIEFLIPVIRCFMLEFLFVSILNMPGKFLMVSCSSAQFSIIPYLSLNRFNILFYLFGNSNIYNFCGLFLQFIISVDCFSWELTFSCIQWFFCDVP